jgi:tetratricopeptide (TPR) repeat protein
MDTRGIPTRDPEWLFGNLYPNRVEVFVGENVAFTGKTAGASRTFSFLQPGGTGAWPPGIVLEGLSKKTVSDGFFLFDADANDAAKARARAEEELVGGYLAAGMNEHALELIDRALPRKPRDGQLLFQLGQAHFKLGHWAQAIDGFARSLAGEGGGSVKRTRDTWAHILAGMACDASGRRDDALVHYRAALAIGADNQNSLATARRMIETPFDPHAHK